MVEPETHCFSLNGWQLSFREPPVSAHHAGISGTGSQIQLFNMGPGVQTQVITLAEQELLSTGPSSQL